MSSLHIYYSGKAINSKAVPDAKNMFLKKKDYAYTSNFSLTAHVTGSGTTEKPNSFRGAMSSVGSLNLLQLNS